MNQTTLARKILIIEDDSTLLRELTLTFTQENFEVKEANNGEAGLEYALRERPHAILLDIMMPKMDGMTVMKKIREASEWGRKVPIIILTNIAPDDKITKAVAEHEPSYYLVKGDWNIHQVVEKVKDCLK